MSDVEDIEDIVLPIVAKRGPYKVEVEKGKTYYWCQCGLSKNQPFCDGSHRKHPEAGIGSLPYTAEEDGTVWMCGCKLTKSAPMCDGTHNSLPEEKADDDNPATDGVDAPEVAEDSSAPKTAAPEESYAVQNEGGAGNTAFCTAARVTGGLTAVSGLAVVLAGPSLGDLYQTNPVSSTQGTLYRLVGATTAMAGVAIYASAQSSSAGLRPYLIGCCQTAMFAPNIIVLPHNLNPETRRDVALGTAAGFGAIAGVLGSAVVNQPSLWTSYATMEVAGCAAFAGYWIYEAFRQHSSL